MSASFGEIVDSNSSSSNRWGFWDNNNNPMMQCVMHFTDAKITIELTAVSD